MKINEKLSILFWLKREKASKDGRVLFMCVSLLMVTGLVLPPVKRSAPTNGMKRPVSRWVFVRTIN